MADEKRAYSPEAPSSSVEKPSAAHDEMVGETHAAAERGHAATDAYGNSLVHLDPNSKAERRLRMKLDLMLVPTVSLLYLFCFIDRANVGTCILRPTTTFGAFR